MEIGWPPAITSICTFCVPAFEDTALTAGWVPASVPLFYDICAVGSTEFNSPGFDYYLFSCFCFSFWETSDWPTTISMGWRGLEGMRGWGGIEGETGAGGAFSFSTFLSSFTFLSSVLFCWIISCLGKAFCSSYFLGASFKFCSTLCSVRVFLQTFGAGLLSPPIFSSAKGSWCLSLCFYYFRERAAGFVSLVEF